MKERPILFAAPMVRALLAGQKTQTRRVVTLPRWAEPHSMDFDTDPRFAPTGVVAVSKISGCLADVHCPYGVPGDRLWVRETHLLDPPIDDTWPSVGDTFDSIDDIPAHYRKPEHVIYRSTCDWSSAEQARWRWRPSIFMPRWASRITLEVTAVRVERLQDISEADAKAEGPLRLRASGRYVTAQGDQYAGLAYPTARAWFEDGWDSINGKRAPWAGNPYVWVVSFRRLD